MLSNLSRPAGDTPSASASPMPSRAVATLSGAAAVGSAASLAAGAGAGGTAVTAGAVVGVAAAVGTTAAVCELSDQLSEVAGSGALFVERLSGAGDAGTNGPSSSCHVSRGSHGLDGTSSSNRDGNAASRVSATIAAPPKCPSASNPASSSLDGAALRVLPAEVQISTPAHGCAVPSADSVSAVAGTNAVTGGAFAGGGAMGNVSNQSSAHAAGHRGAEACEPSNDAGQATAGTESAASSLPPRPPAAFTSGVNIDSFLSRLHGGAARKQ